MRERTGRVTIPTNLDVVPETYGLFVDTQGRVTALAHRVHNFCSHDTRKAPSQEGTLSTV